jgi:hypothetical protein
MKTRFPSSALSILIQIRAPRRARLAAASSSDWSAIGENAAHSPGKGGMRDFENLPQRAVLIDELEHVAIAARKRSVICVTFLAGPAPSMDPGTKHSASEER